MKKFLQLSFLFLMFATLVSAQQVPWYSYDQTYFKVPTAKDGIYRISSQVLQSSGINLTSLDPRAIRMFHRGKEVAIHIEGANDGKFDSGDFIDFYGLRNDGTLDRLLYTGFSAIPNPYFNTHSDTTAFFLAIMPGQIGKRMVQRAAPLLICLSLLPITPKNSRFLEINILSGKAMRWTSGSPNMTWGKDG